MKANIYFRYFLSSVICCLLLQLGAVKFSHAQSGKTVKDSAVFNFKPSEQTWVVPQGVTQVHIVAAGAQGGGANGGKGGRVTTDLKVTPGQKLVINVGGQPNTSEGGYNGGGKGCGKGFGGGGATDVKIEGTKVLVAGAGGGTGYSGQGGAGGGTTGGNGTYEQDKEGYHIAKGGTQDAGGAGARAYFSKAGTEGQGGEGINNRGNCTNDAMAGGGAGYYGGGGSGAGGGGGGSSYTNNSNSNVSHQQGVNEGNGKLVIYW